MNPGSPQNYCQRHIRRVNIFVSFNQAGNNQHSNDESHPHISQALFRQIFGHGRLFTKAKKALNDRD